MFAYCEIHFSHFVGGPANEQQVRHFFSIMIQ